MGLILEKPARIEGLLSLTVLLAVAGHLPALVDCRPIHVRRAMEAAQFAIRDARLERRWVPVEVVLGLNPGPRTDRRGRPTVEYLPVPRHRTGERPAEHRGRVSTAHPISSCHSQDVGIVIPNVPPQPRCRPTQRFPSGAARMGKSGRRERLSRPETGIVLAASNHRWSCE